MEETSQGKKVMIAVVDDEQMLLNVFNVLLKRSPYGVECFGLPTLVYNAIKQEPDKFQLLVTDIRMPEMDGVTLAKKVRDIKPDMPIIFMSGHTSEEARQEGGALGKVKFLDKPFSFEEVVRQVIPGFLKDCGLV